MKHLFTLSEWLRAKWERFATLASSAMQSLKATKRQSDTTIFAKSLKSLKSLMSIFSSRGVMDVRLSLGQYPTDIQRISNLYLTPNRFFTRFAAVFALVFVLGVGNVFCADVTGTIYFGNASGSTAVSSTSVTGNDSQENEWTITTVISENSFTQNASYSQIGASKKPATSITFTTSLPSAQTITAFSAKFGGFSGTAGTVTLKVGETTVGTGSLNATNDVIVSATNTTTSGTVLTVTVTGISKGVKAYYISYSYPKPEEKCNVTLNRNGVTETINNVVVGTDIDDIDGTSAQGGCSAWTFEGWSKTQRAAQNVSTPMTLVTEVDGPGPYYAVYSHTESGGGSTNGSKTFTFSSIASANSWVNGTAYTPVTINPVSIAGNGGGNNAKYYSSDNTWRMYNGGTVNITVTGGSVTSVSSSSSKTFSISNGTASLSCSETIKFTEITVNYTISGGSTTYYSTTATCCEPLAQINGSVSVTNPTAQRSITVNWANETTVSDVDHYELSYKVKGAEGDPTVINNIANNVNTYTVSGLACSTTYQFTLTAVGNSTHCDYTSDVIEGTTADAYSAPTLNYSSTALTVGGSTASPSWATAPTHTGTLSYASSNTAVITVNSSTGVVTPVGAGEAHVIASWAQSADYCAATKNSVDITVTGNVSVSFNANGGGGTMTNQSIQVNTPTELKENEFTAPSSCQYFYGWATSKENADAGTRAYENGQSVTINAGMELFAIWKTYNYTVTDGTNEGAATFTLPSNVDCGGTISITCAADGTHKGDPTITATEGKYSAINVLSATSAEITGVSGNITVNISYAAKENYSITWKVNGEALTGSALDGVTTDVLEGGSITNLPASPAGLDCAATFMGWSTDEIGMTPLNNEDDAARIAALGLFKNAANAPAIAAYTTFHAVFATETQAGSNSLTKMGTGDNLANNDEIVIVANGIKYALYQEDDGSNYMKYWEFEGDNPTLSDLDDVKKSWIVASSNGKWKLGDATNGYLYNSSSTNISCPTNNYSEWSLTDNNDGTFNLTATQILSCRSDLNGGNKYKWRGAGNSGNSGTPALLIYKKVSTPAVYDNYVTKCCKPWDNPTVAYGSYNLVAGGEHASVTITGTQHGTPEFTSSNTSVIEVNASTGEVTPIGAGTAHVIVTWPSANDYCEKTLNSSDFTVTGIAVITFKLNGGSVAGDVEKTQNVTTGEDVALTSLATLGYVAPNCKEFGGWAASEEDANAATPVVFKADGATINVSEATNLWAIWNTKTFAVTDGTIDTSVASHSFSGTVACGSDLTITCAAAAAYKGNPTVTATGVHGEITVNSATSVTIANVQSAIAVSIAYETAKAEYAITWKVNGSALEGAALDGVTTNVYEGSAIENLPSVADNAVGACANKFMGWSKHDYKSVKKAASDYDDLFSDAEHAPEISEATTFYAVFAKQTIEPEVEHNISFSRSGNTDTYTENYTFNATASAENGYYKDKSSGVGDVKLYHTSTAFFTSAPASVELTAKIGGGSAKDPLGNNVRAQFVDKDGAAIGNIVIVTTKVEEQTGKNYVVNMDLTGLTSAYGVRLFHEKETSYNVRYYSFSLSYTTGGTTVSNYVTECAAVEAPTFGVAAGTYNEAQSVSLDCATDGATIKYTTDGTEPSKTVGTEYTAPIAVNQSMTIKAIAIKGEDVSDVAEAAYVLKVSTPEISGNTSFVSSATVTITAADGTSIYYTTNGVDPTTESTPYTAPFTVDADGTTVKAIAVKTGWTSSEIASQAFTKITPKTVAEANTAIAALSANGTIANQYVKGLISQIDKFNDDNTITYYISDNGTTTSQLQVYHGSAGVANNGNAFTAKENLQLGEEVIVSGTLKKYVSGNKTTPEFVNPNEIVAYKTHSPIAWSANAYTAELGGSENEFPTLSGTTGLTISYSSSDETVATISADGTTYDLKKTGETTITATSVATDDFVATTKSYTLTVSPTVIRVDLDIDCNGATSGCPETTHLVKQTSLPNPLPEVTKTGKNFGGWYTDNTFETPAVAGAALTENTTIYAQWLEPYTVAEALTMIAALGNDEKTAENVYVAGVVTADAVSIDNKTATYKIKDATVNNSLEIYKGKGLNNADVATGDLQEGDQVVVYGQLMKYKGYSSTTKPEIVDPNYLYSFTRPTFDVESVSLPSTANVRAGKTVTLTAEITPSNATNKNVTWSVKSGDAYAEVSAAGVVTGLAEGTAVIEVETEDGGFKAQCTVTVAGALPTFTEDDHEWIKITSASKLVAGRFYVIASESKGKTMTKSVSGGRMAEVASTFDNGVIAVGDLGSNTAIFELGGNSTDGWTLLEVSTDKYLSGTTSSSLSWSDAVANTAISFNEGDAVIGNASGNRILHNVSSKWFAPYSSNTNNGMLLPQLYMWAELSHSVTFDANGGVAESVPDVERTDEGKIIIPATTPTHSDISKAFAGWYKSDAPATLYNAGDEFETNVDVTLYAKWNTVPTYTVTYVPGGAGTVPAVASYREGQKVQVEEASLSNPGYSFAGWTVKDADQNVLPLDEENKFDMPASNVTITAVWSRISNQKWTLVKQGETLEIDAEYVIAYNSTTVKKALGAISSNIGTPVDVTIDGEILKGSDAMKVLTLKAGNGGENYAFQSGSKYLTYSGSGNTLNESEDPNDASSWTIAIDENNVATISNVDASTRKLQYNTSSPRFACYTGSQKAVQLYKKAASVVINGEQTVNAAGITANADVTIKNGGTLNVDADKQIGDLTVEAGGQVVLDANKLTVVGTFTIETTMASGASGQLNGATELNFEAQEDAYIDITLGDNGNPEKWHAFTVPFPVDAINGIYDLDGKKLVNEVNYAIMDYHGDIRATGNYGWKKYRGVLVPGTFYLMTVDGLRTTYRFKKTANGAIVAGNTKQLYEYASSTGNNDNGWNGVGNPTLMYGTVDQNVQVLNPVSYTYEPYTAGNQNFVVGTPFFVQAASDGTMTMSAADGSKQYYAPARQAAKEIKDVKVTFGNDEYTDKLYISASEDALNEYETGKDLAKMTMTSTPKVAQIFGKAYNAKLCMVYAPMANDQAVYDLTLYAPKAGEYTIAAPAMENADLYLTYEGSIIWDLSKGEYINEFAKGNNEGYGLLLQAKMPMTPTGIEDVQGDNVQCTKVVIDEHVYILRGGQMYDVTGKAVK